MGTPEPNPFGTVYDKNSLYDRFKYPWGLTVGEYGQSGTSSALAATGSGEVPALRPRSSSNATQDISDLRESMRRSLTDLFTDIGYLTEVRSIQLIRISIAILCSALTSS